jgi:type IV pilus assembly protein PilB
MSTRRLGQILVDLGFITDEQLEVVLEEQEQQSGMLLGRIAEDMQLITGREAILRVSDYPLIYGGRISSKHIY